MLDTSLFADRNQLLTNTWTVTSIYRTNKTKTIHGIMPLFMYCQVLVVLLGRMLFRQLR